MINDLDTLANIIKPDGATDYQAREIARTIIKAGFKRGIEIPKTYRLERIITKCKKSGLETTALARALRAELLK